MSDTICAIATAKGGAIGIVRISGPKTSEIISEACGQASLTSTPRKVVFTPIKSPEGELLDEGLVTYFPSPNSYTGEDCAEISCHGSRYVLNKVLETLIRHGARLANPGEFTQRAFLNGKLDLSQAEAVADLIASTNHATHQMAMSQLKGHFSSELKKLRDQLLRLTSLLELELDFSDHEDLVFADRKELLQLAETIDRRITELADSFETGQALKHGIPVAIVGKTNVGKSTLLNQLLGDERAIVSDIHGTTRDTIEDTIEFEGIEYRFIDTAGLRQTTDAIEQIGIDRAKQKIEEARIIIWMLDTQPTQIEYDEMKQLLAGKEVICAHNKSDLLDKATFTPYIDHLHLISAKQGDGIESLKKGIHEAASRLGLTGNELIVSNARHYEALLRAHESLKRVKVGLSALICQGEGESSFITTDLIAEDLRLTLAALADITGGAITPQETLNNIFSHFCVGK